MAEINPDNPEQAAAPDGPVVFVHASGTAAIEKTWLAGILALGCPVFSHSPLEGCSRTRHDYAQLGGLLAELAHAAPGQVVFLVRNGMAPDQRQIRAIAGLLEASGAPVVQTVLSNAWPALNPFAGLSGPQLQDQEECSRIVRILGSGQRLRHHHWPDHFTAISPAALEILAKDSVFAEDALVHLQQGGGRLEADDRIYVGTPGEPLFAATRLDEHAERRPPAWGELSARLQTWLEAGSPRLPDIGAGGKPVTLHISHSWGGGVSQWIKTFIAHDTSSTHLQLLSEGPQPGDGHGQRVTLYAASQLDCPIASWWMQPPIQSVDDRNAQYRQALDDILCRYAVGRVMVSSLVGQGLDALRTGLPTVKILHDYFPVWPLLGVHPEQYIEKDGTIDLGRALQEARQDREFRDRGPDSWRGVREAYLAALAKHKVIVTAPSQSVIDLQNRLDANWKDISIQLIPHGFPPLANSAPVAAKDRQDDRLRLVIMGRVQAGKGQRLLLKALPKLIRHAHVYLLGTGQNGEAFFGMSGVNVLVEYARKDLPGILHDIGPHAAALLSVVPETFSYTLSELQHLGIPVIATRVGSFSERIRDGVNGWLIDPSPWALVDRVESLCAQPEAIDAARKALASVAHAEPETMVTAYSRLCPAAGPAPSGNPWEPGLLQAQASSAAFKVTEARISGKRLQQTAGELEREVAKRTEWALDTERELEREQRRREKVQEHLEESTAFLDKARVDFSTARAELDVALEEKKQAALDLEDVKSELNEARQVLGETQNSLRDTLRNLKETNASLEAVQDLQAEILASSSWRITRPLRVLRRITGTFIRSHAWNPLRWPLLLARFTHNLATVGLRGTLMRMQYTGQSVAPEALPFEDQVKPVGHAQPPATLPCSSRPLASIVIPAYNNWAYSAACLRSIAETAGANRIEVILVDDASSDTTPDSAAAVRGLVSIRNEENLGFIGSCNRGAAEARGEYIVLLNNDTQVTDGWLEALLETFEQFPEAGLVGAKLVYPDGSLQECGGLLFQDGSGWNYGRGDDPDKPEYQFLRETDYCSGACLMIKAETFRDLGGFDTHYAPAYYEDTDLAFRVRKAGQKVFVQPRAIVIHHEGITSGTDLSSGVKRHQVTNQARFLERWSHVLEDFSPRIEDPTNLSLVRKARDHHLKGRVLIIDATTPEPDQDSGSVRLTNLMGCFRDLGYGVTFFADNRCHAGRYTRELQDAGVEVVYTPWLDSLGAFFQERGDDFDYVLISRHYVAVNYISLVKRHCRRAKLIFDTVDLHYLREQRLAELEHSLPLQQAARQTRRSELSVIAATDAVLVVSPAEVEILAQDAPDARVHILSNIHPVHGCRVGFADRSDLFFVGGYQHPPNIDAMLWFVNKIWPLIRSELPDARFHMIGSKAPEQIRALGGDGVIFHGFVEDLQHFLDQCRLAVAPLRYGAGVKGKVNMSMSYGQPVVATPIAIEGMYAENGREILVAETEQAFAEEVIRLYQDEALWNSISRAAIENVENHFSLAAARRSIEDLIIRLG